MQTLSGAKWSYVNRGVSDRGAVGLGDLDREPRLRDLVVAKLVSVNAHDSLEDVHGRRVRLYPGDLVVGAFGNRYATDYYEGYLPTGTVAHLLTAGGEMARVASAHVRNTDSAERAAADIRATTGRDDVRVARLDLADRSTIDAFTADWTRPLHILVNNAGVLALPERTTTPEGWETQFATNHLGHAALTLGLHDALTAARGARVVVSSSAHLMYPVVFDDIHFTSRPYDAGSAYGQSKTATILFTVALAKRWAADGITANALHPGGILTNIQRHFDEAQLRLVGAVDEQGRRLDVAPGWKTPQQGAATSVLLAASPLVQGVSGRYFEDCNEAVVVTEPGDDSSGVAPYALDPNNADRLWDETARLLQR